MADRPERPSETLRELADAWAAYQRDDITKEDFEAAVAARVEWLESQLPTDDEVEVDLAAIADALDDPGPFEKWSEARRALGRIRSALAKSREAVSGG